jgi:ATP-dependent exoDNAse (exonuclease V) alpha subunit
MDPAQCHTVSARANHAAAQKFLEVQPRFDTLPYAAVGARAMLLRNISPQQHMMNGSCGTITAIQHDDNNCPTSISVEFDDASRAVPIRRTTAKTLVLDGHTFRKTTFPLALCYAMTGHKAEGATIRSPVIIDIKSAFAAGLVYTMLTRVTSRSHLKIIGRITVEMLRVAVNMPEPEDNDAEED